MWRRLFTGKHLTWVLDSHARAGMYSPEIHVHRRGRNGSPAGFGPMVFPAWLLRLDRRWRKPYDWGGMLVIPVPHVRWHYPQSPLRRMLYQLNYRLITKVVSPG